MPIVNIPHSVHGLTCTNNDAEARNIGKRISMRELHFNVLAADSDYLSTLQDITDTDMKVSSDVTVENR